MMTTRQTNGDWKTPLGGLVKAWLDRHETKAKWLAERAGKGHSALTLIKQGRTPRPETLRLLADAMGIARGTVMLAAGWISAEDLTGESENVEGEEKDLLEAYRLLDAQGRRAVRRLAQVLHEPSGPEESHESHQEESQ